MKAAETAAALYVAAGLQTHAVGRCCLASFALAALLLDQRIECQMVVWLLHPGSQEKYLDHWAVAAEYPYVLDPTYAQVKGVTGRVCVDARYDYPAHYLGPHLYPARPLLDAAGYDFLEKRISIARLLRLARVMAAYDGGAYLQVVEKRYGKA